MACPVPRCTVATEFARLDAHLQRIHAEKMSNSWRTWDGLEYATDFILEHRDGERGDKAASNLISHRGRTFVVTNCYVAGDSAAGRGSRLQWWINVLGFQREADR